MAATTSSTSTGCSSLFNCRSNPVEPRVRYRSTSSHGSPGCGKLDGVAMWFINGLAGAFFASLERCSCIRIATEEDDGDEANDIDAPLILNDGNLMVMRQQEGTAGTISKKRTGKGKGSNGATVDDQGY